MIVLQSCLAPCDPVDCSLPGSSVHGILQAIPLLQGIFPTQGSNPGLPHCRQILYCLSRWESPITSVLMWLLGCLPLLHRTWQTIANGINLTHGLFWKFLEIRMICTVLNQKKIRQREICYRVFTWPVQSQIFTLRLSIEALLVLGLTHCWLPETQDLVSFADVPGKLYKVPDP